MLRRLFLAVSVGTLAATATTAAEAQGKSKHYAVSTKRAVVVTRDVLIRQGFDVVRIDEAGDRHIVYYRRGNMGKGKGKGRLEKMVIRQVKDRVVFEAAPSAVLVDIDIKLKL